MNVLANRRPRALVSSAVRIVTNVFWVLYFKFLPSVFEGRRTWTCRRNEEFLVCCPPFFCLSIS